MPTAGPSVQRPINEEQDEGAEERKNKKQKFSRSRQACLQVSLLDIYVDQWPHMIDTELSAGRGNQNAERTLLIRVPIA